MNNLSKIVTASITAAFAAAPAMADHHMEKEKADYKAQSPEIVERNERGKATKVRIEGIIYEVCMTEGQDACIQPRAAGLEWGDRPLGYWPEQRKSAS